MKAVIRTVLCMFVAAPLSTGLMGCAQKNKQSPQTTDPMIQNYMQERSNLASQRRRLAETYGPTSPTVALMDQQIKYVDEAMNQRRQQLIEQENARQEVQRMKAEPAPIAPSSRPVK